MTDRIPLSDLTSDQLDALYDRITELEAGPETFEDGGVNDIRELYAAQDAITASGGQLSRSVHRAIDAIRARWDAALRREQQRAEQAEAERNRVQERACRLAECLRKAEAEREQLRTIARTHWDTTERVRALHDSLAREDMLASPEDLIARGRAAENIAAALDGWTPTAPDQPQPSEAYQPAYDAVFAYIRSQPVDFLPATVVERNAMIWRAVHAALGQPQQTKNAEAG